MHELPAVTQIIRTLDEESEKNKSGKIVGVRFVIGELSSIEEECVREYFDLLSQGKSFEGAVLEFEREYARLRCPSCGNEFEHKKSFDCPCCGTGGVLIKGTGRDFVIKEVVLDG